MGERDGLNGSRSHWTLHKKAGESSSLQSSVTMRPVGRDAETHAELVTRVGWLLDLVRESEHELLRRLWTVETFDRLHSGCDSLERALPSSASTCAERLGWRAEAPEGTHVPSRFKRIVQAQAISALRTLAFRDAVVSEETRGEDGPASRAFARGVRRQIIRYLRDNPYDGRELRLTDLQNPPSISLRARLAATDTHFSHLDWADETVVLRVKLPTTPRPVGRTEWAWATVECRIPEHLRARTVVKWHLPDLTLDRKGVLLRFAYTEQVPEQPDIETASAVVGVDWSPGALGHTAIVATGSAGGLTSDYRGLRFDDRGLLIRLERLQRQGQLIQEKADRIAKLIPNAARDRAEQLRSKLDRLLAEANACGRKRTRINRELSWLFACFVTERAVAAGAQAVAVEDLRTLEARGLGRETNNRVAQSIRRKAVEAVTHTAARAGLHTVEVPAPGTSKNCPGCDDEVLRPRGYHSAYCQSCRVGGNRDTIGAVNIGKRALVSRPKDTRPKDNRQKGTTRLRVRAIEHTPVVRSRDKTAPTPKRPRHRRVRHTLPAQVLRERDRNKRITVRERASSRSAVSGKPPGWATRVDTNHSHSPPQGSSVRSASARES